MHSQQIEKSSETLPGALPGIFEKATAEALDRIRRDAARFTDDADAAALFEYLEHHLFDLNLDVHVWRRGSGASRTAYDRVVSEVGPLKAYIDELRIAVACPLVTETDAVFSDIGRRVGYEVLKTFGRTFKRVRGQTPGEMRSGQDPALPDTIPPDTIPSDIIPSDVIPEDIGSPETVPSSTNEPELDADVLAGVSPRADAAEWRRRVSLGLHDRGRIAELRRLLRRQYPSLEEAPPSDPDGEPALPSWVKRPIRFVSTDETLGWFAALTVMSRLIRLPDDELRHAVVHGIRFGQLSGFYLLHEVSFKLFSRDVEKSLKLAELTVETAEAHPEKQAGENADWRASAWGWLGHLRMLAGDLGGANAAFVFAREEWAAPREKTLPAVEIRVHRHEAALRKVERRYEEAIALIDHAIGVCHKSGIDDALRLDCYLERSELARITGDPATAIEILSELLRSPELFGLLQVRTDEEENALRHMLLVSLAKARVLAGEYEAAEVCFREAREACPQPSDRTEKKLHHWHAELDRAESRLRLRTGHLEQAESLMRSALEGFTRLKVMLARVLVTAELAGVLAYLGRREEARVLAEKGVVFLGWLGLHREARRAARLLKALPEAEEVGLEEIDELCRDLDLAGLEALSLPLDMNRLPEELQS